LSGDAERQKRLTTRVHTGHDDRVLYLGATHQRILDLSGSSIRWPRSGLAVGTTLGTRAPRHDGDTRSPVRYSREPLLLIIDELGSEFRPVQITARHAVARRSAVLGNRWGILTHGVRTLNRVLAIGCPSGMNY
jgi:hypothetical protein